MTILVSHGIMFYLHIVHVVPYFMKQFQYEIMFYIISFDSHVTKYMENKLITCMLNMQINNWKQVVNVHKSIWDKQSIVTMLLSRSTVCLPFYPSVFLSTKFIWPIYLFNWIRYSFQDWRMALICIFHNLLSIIFLIY